MSWTKTGIWPSSGLPPQWSKCRWQFAASLSPDGRQRLAQPYPAGAVVRVNLGMGSHASVEQDHSLGVGDGVAQAGFGPGHPRPGLFRWPYEVAEINAPHRDTGHSAILATGTRHDKG